MRALCLAALAGLCAAATSGCSTLHDWDVQDGSTPNVDGSRDDANSPDAGCPDVCGGACVDLASDVEHCGSCDVDCRVLTNVLPGAVGVRCLAGRCSIPPEACAPGFADCVGATDGCETDLALPSSCGSCANRCTDPTPLCDASSGTCTDACVDGRMLCGTSCVDTTSDPRNCSDCGLGCSAIAGSAPTCAESVCGYTCLPGRHDCGTVCGLDTSPLTCGTSCTPCSTRENADSICPMGACESPCLTGFHDCSGVCVPSDDTASCGTKCSACQVAPGARSTCDGTTCGVACPAGEHVCGDGCLPDADIGSCGSACAPCPTPPNTRASCDAGVCGTVCRDTHADCNGSGDGSDADGCETDLSDPLHCGSCTVACGPPNPLCGTTSGTFGCVNGCAPGQTACGTSCADLDNSVLSCGLCGLACTAPANGEAACSAGVCGVLCDAGFHACSDACVANTSADSCGSSCSACPAPLNATATCDGVTCGWACNAGSHMCGGTCADDRGLATCGTSCTPCPTPANGAATCDGSSCGFICDAGFHRCGSECVANVSPATCGASCSACPAPENGVATCDGSSCEFVCAPSYHRCGGACVPDAATATCGAACSPCAPPPNADATCDGVACGFTCRAGFHRCGDVCVPSNSLSSCGMSCSPCVAPANSVATCDGAACGFDCSPGFADCDGTPGNGCEADLSAADTCGSCTRACVGSTRICSGGTCSSGCVTPTPTSCAGSCVDLMSDPANCGACGTGCTAPANASPTCSGTTCSFVCDPGFHACGSTCASNDSPVTCGASCSPCAAPPGATATCAAGACGFVCNGGFNRCGAACVPEDSITQCGTSCATCTAPSSGVPVCSGGACDFTCVSGTHRCGASCVSNAGTGSCGASCVPCIAPANAASTCDGTTCGFACNPGYLRAGAACVPVPPPRPISPLSMSNVTSLSPVLRWVLAAGTDGARIEVCADRACSMVARSLDVTGSTGTVAPALTPGLWFWRLTGRVGANTGVVTSPVWEMTLTHRSTPRSTAWGATIDHNGDGYADALVGAPNAAAAYTYRGSAAGLSSTASGTLTGAASFGRSVSAAGDLDGDGFSDVVVGAPGARTAVVFYGSPTGLGGRTATTLLGPSSTYGASVSAAGDLDGDGYGELVVAAPGAGRVYVHRGSPSGVETTAAWVIVGPGTGFGASVASAGDVNADGFADIIVGDPDRARASVYHGAAAGLGATPVAARTLTGATTFGEVVAGAGDVNGDGYTDVIVGTPEDKSATVFLGSATGLPTSGVTLRVAMMAFGGAVSSAGDVDGDGYDDVVIGSEGTRRAWIFRGGTAGIATMASATFNSPSSGSTNKFGASVSSSGDYDGDDVSDVIIGAPGAASAYAYLGVLGAVPSTTPAVVLTGPAGSSYGQAVALLLIDARRLWSAPEPRQRAKKA